MNDSADKRKQAIHTIGDLSTAVGCDVRELFISGYSQRQVSAVAHGRVTLAEMYKQGPENEPIDTKAVMEKIRKEKGEGRV